MSYFKDMCWKCGQHIADGESDGMTYTSDPPRYAHKVCPEQQRYDHSKCPAMPRKSWQEEYKEEYEAKLGKHPLDSLTDDDLKQIDAMLNIPTGSEILAIPGVGQISRDDYEVQ